MERTGAIGLWQTGTNQTLSVMESGRYHFFGGVILAVTFLMLFSSFMFSSYQRRAQSIFCLVYDRTRIIFHR